MNQGNRRARRAKRAFAWVLTVVLVLWAVGFALIHPWNRALGSLWLNYGVTLPLALIGFFILEQFYCCRHRNWRF